MQHVPFGVCLFSLSILRSRFTHVVACVRISFLVKLLTSYWLLWIMLLWTWVYRFLFEPLLSLLWGRARSGISGLYGNFLFNFWGKKYISTVAALFYLPTTSYQVLFSTHHSPPPYLPKYGVCSWLILISKGFSPLREGGRGNRTPHLYYGQGKQKCRKRGKE